MWLTLLKIKKGLAGFKFLHVLNYRLKSDDALNVGNNNSKIS